MKFLSYKNGELASHAVLYSESSETLEIIDLKEHAQVLPGYGAPAEAVRHLADRDLVALIEVYGDLKAALDELVRHSRQRGLIKTIKPRSLLAPIPRPARNIFCVGRNYLDHIREGDLTRGITTPIPRHPQFFTKPPSTVIGHEAAIEIELEVSDQIDYEVELAVVIGKAARNLTAANAMDCVWGYTVFNDVTARDIQRRHDQWFKGKGLDTFGPMGPFIVTADELPDPHACDIELRVNGQVRQQDNTSHMHFRIPDILAALSQGMTLQPGDVIATGTPPGVGYAMDPPGLLQPGDVVDCKIKGIGVLRNHVRLRA
ncbi:MAG: fumarylacetoacetate hydrolase family protein [Pseudomonadota bacterium]